MHMQLWSLRECNLVIDIYIINIIFDITDLHCRNINNFYSMTDCLPGVHVHSSLKDIINNIVMVIIAIYVLQLLQIIFYE